MTGPESTIPETLARRACLVAGCSCKDPRILSRRRAAWIASRARANGQTADRVIAAELGWSFIQAVTHQADISTEAAR